MIKRHPWPVDFRESRSMMGLIFCACLVRVALAALGLAPLNFTRGR
jgi:hypothetical protein